MKDGHVPEACGSDFPALHDFARFRTITRDMPAKTHDSCTIWHDSNPNPPDFGTKLNDYDHAALIDEDKGAANIV
jgi:hypothetical protein